MRRPLARAARLWAATPITSSIWFLLLFLAACKSITRTQLAVEGRTPLGEPGDQLKSLCAQQRRPEAAGTRLKRHTAPTTSKSNQSGPSAPQFAAPIGNVSAAVGRDVRLVCTVDHLGQHQVAWLKEETKTILSIDTNIIITNYRIFLIPDEEARKWVLHIKDVQESDRGFYRCQVNTNPMISTLGYLEVVVPPSIVEPETSQVAEAVEHSNVSLQCKASGHPRPSISWRREDGEPIRLTGSGSKLSKRAQWWGQSVGSTGSPIVSSDSVQSLAKRATREPETMSHLLSDIRGDKLTLTNVDRTMAGLYVCSASNGVPSQVSRQIPLYVKFPPKVTIVQRPSVSVALGEQLELECLIEAFPKPTSYWSGQQLAQSAPPIRRTSELGQLSWERAARGRWLSGASGVTSQWPNALGERAQLGGPPPSGSTHKARVAQMVDTSLRRQLEAQETGGFADEALAWGPLARLKSPLAAPGGEQAEQQQAVVSVKQTTVSSHTYKLNLRVNRTRSSDLGEYVCISSNSMGTSSARIQVRAKTGDQADFSEAALVGSRETSRGQDQEREIEYQRDTLTETSSAAATPSDGDEHQDQMAPPRPAPHNKNEATRNHHDDGGGGGDGDEPSGRQLRKPTASYVRQTNRVYDENYLQSIRDRQSSSGQATPAGKLQQKLKMTPLSEHSRHSAGSSLAPTRWALVGLLIVAVVVVAAWPHTTSTIALGALVAPR